MGYGFLATSEHMKALNLSKLMIHRTSPSLCSIASTLDLVIRTVGSSVALNGHLLVVDRLSALASATPCMKSSMIGLVADVGSWT